MEHYEKSKPKMVVIVCDFCGNQIVANNTGPSLKMVDNILRRNNGMCGECGKGKRHLVTPKHLLNRNRTELER